jgi:hypothetical protein
MANELEFYFRSSDIQELIDTGCEGILVSCKIVFVSSEQSTVEIKAKNFGGTQAEEISKSGCPMPCSMTSTSTNSE